MKKPPLWEELSRTYGENFWAEDRDRWAAVLRTLASRADDWMEHATDDSSITEDLTHWLTYEAEVAEAPPLPVPDLKKLAVEALSRCPGPVKDLSIIRRALDALQDGEDLIPQVGDLRIDDSDPTVMLVFNGTTWLPTQQAIRNSEIANDDES